LEAKDSNKGSATYGAKDIFVLEGSSRCASDQACTSVPPVLWIASPYLGGGGHGIDEAMAGYAKNITVELLPGTA